MTILETKNLKKYYGKGDTQVKALDGVNLSVEDGEFVAIVGTSGSGKSTLLHMLGGLDRPTSGSVTVDGKNIFSLKDEALTIFRRRKIGFVFQSFNLVPVLTVRENIVLPIQLDGGKVDERYVGEVVTALGLEKKLNSLPGQLSGGQQQRVAIARALATKPAILLADEPTGNLDSRTSQDVLSLMKVTGRKFSQTMVMITHNEEIAQLSDRIVRIEDGRMNLQISPQLMDEMIEEALHHVNRKSCEHTITTQYGDEILLVNVDARLIMQVVVNLVDNAIKYTPVGSVIQISAYRKDHQVVVEVADNGPGIPDRAKAQVFEMFYTGQSRIADSHRSLGLGLPLCRAILTAHGGTLTLRDNIPNGSVFSFALPQSEVNIHE